MQCREAKENFKVVKVVFQNIIDQQTTDKLLVYVQHK
jgi:hypothetical protein